MDTLAHRLKLLGPTIVEMCRISGTSGVSPGVLHQNEVIHLDNFGYRDVEANRAPDQDTLYFVASLSKLFTAAGIGILVDKKKLEWDTPVSRILQEFDHPDETIKNEAGIVDFLSHRTGLAGKTQMWYLEFARPALPRGDTMRFSSYLDVVFAFQQRWLYNNWGYGLADEFMEKVSGKSWGTFLRERIFDPLGMKGTTTQVDPDTENVAKGYMALSDGAPYSLPRPRQGDGKLAEGAAGVQSNVRDLLTFYKNVMQADGEQSTSSPFKNIPIITSPHVALDPEPAASERSYALGYACSIVPHLSSAHLLPDTNTAVVVLTNSMANNDAADWLGQLLLETVLDNPHKNDYVAIAKKSAAASVALWPAMAKELETRREPNTPRQPLTNYEGKYYNIIGDWCIDVFETEGILQVCFQAQRNESYPLEQYRPHEFSWLLTRDENVRRGRFPVVSLDFYILTFRAPDEAGMMQQLVWRHDPDVPLGEIFYRRPYG